MRKMIASVAVAGSLGVGGVAGMLLGTPSLSGAQSTSVNAGTESIQVASDPMAAPGTVAAFGAVEAVVGAMKADGGPLNSAIDEALKGLVDKGTINQSQADAVKAAVQEKLASMPRPGPGPKAGLAREALTAAAKALGMSEADLMTQLQSGKTVAAIAKEKNVDVNNVVEALVAEATARIDQAAKDGKFTAEQATKMKSDLKERITNLVNNPLPIGRGPGGPDGPGRGGPKGANIEPAAKAIGITTDELATQLRDGKTIADVAKAKNVDVNTVIDAIVADTTAKLDQAVKDGKLTAEQAAAKKAGVKERVTNQVNNPVPPKESRGHGGRGGPGDDGPGDDGAGDDGPASGSSTAKPAASTTL